MTPLEAALDWIRRGFAPVPIPHRSKKPILKEWQKLAITDGETGTTSHTSATGYIAAAVVGWKGGGMTPASVATERIRQASDIVRIVGSYVKLRRTGRRRIGLCPLHKESTPSFTVDPTKQRWRCYGCGAAGDVFDFIRQIEGTNFPGARARLAELAGISLEGDKLSPEDARQWTAECRVIQHDLPAAKLWLSAVMKIGELLLEVLKEGLWDREAPMQPYIGEVSQWTRRVARWREITYENGWAHEEKRLRNNLVEEYRRWHDRNPKLARAMVRTGAKWQRALRDDLRVRLGCGR
jgi:hypothetical protein